jgi:diguanylate cyclase (GGDEF)-like protein
VLDLQAKFSADSHVRRIPSMLAMADLHRRTNRVLQEMRLGEDEIVAFLRLDPLAVLRGLRAADAPVLRRGSPATTIREMVRSLGPTLARRLVLTDPISGVGTTELRQLWRHSIATALAAEDLATRTGLIDPEAAYLLGLLHDYEDWIGQLVELPPPARRQDASALDAWVLPAPFAAQLLAIDLGPPAASPATPNDITTLVRAAELLAELADFRHPGDELDAWLGTAFAHADKADLLAANRLRRRVEGAMRTFGLDPSIPDSEVLASSRLSEPETKTRGSLDEVVIGVLGCARSPSYRGIVTVLTTAAVRYGNFDRAFLARFHAARGTLVLRAKSDSSSRPLRQHHLPLTPAETASLQDALGNERPTILQRPRSGASAMLTSLAADEVLAMPLNREFGVPSFLLLDRSLSLAPIELDGDRSMATMLGMTGALLTQNLLMRRRRQRADKFALTDPLTRLFNRRMGIHALEQALARSQRSGQPLTVLMCDLDHFKRLNDTMGHQKGDAALQATAEVLRQTLRKSDTSCRYGGEEFLVVLPDTDAADAAVLATRLNTAVHARGEELGLPVTISIGLTTAQSDDTATSLLHRADRALYASKGYGRNRFSADVDPGSPLANGPDTRPHGA